MDTKGLEDRDVTPYSPKVWDSGRHIEPDDNDPGIVAPDSNQQVPDRNLPRVFREASRSERRMSRG